MSWDGEGRRPVRDKQGENGSLRRLTVALMKVKEDNVISRLEIDEELKQSILLCRSITEFRGKRRMERTVQNNLREAEEEDVQQLFGLVGNEDQAQQALQEEIQQLTQHLLQANKEDIEEFYLEHPACNLQQLRQLIRNVQKAKGDAIQKQQEKLQAFVQNLVFGE